jgi:hypothetical protein
VEWDHGIQTASEAEYVRLLTRTGVPALLGSTETDAIVPRAGRGAFACSFIIDRSAQVLWHRLAASDIQRDRDATGRANADLMRHAGILIRVERKAHGASRICAARNSLTTLQTWIKRA